jgi:hypothetical protein
MLSKPSIHKLISYFLLASFFFCIAIVGVLIWDKTVNGCRVDRSPIKIVDVSVDGSKSQEVLVQFMRFAEENAMLVEVNYYGIKGDYFSIWMDRQDVEVFATNSSERGEFQIAFYNNDCIHPIHTEDVNLLFHDLKSILSEIPNIKITERN